MKIETGHGYYTADDNQLFHSFDDEPAIVIDSYQETNENKEITEIEGYKAWYKNGELHREVWPAIIRNNGEEFYYINGQRIWQS